MSRPWTDAELESGLRELAAAVEYPSAPALAVAVGDRLRAETRPRARGFGWVRTPRRVVLAALLALVILATGVLTFSPAARHAVARWLGLEGARIETVPTLPPVSPTRSPIDLLLGERVTLGEARGRAAFDLVLPAELPPPDAVFFDDRLPGGRVTLGWRDPYPLSPHTGYALLLGEFVGSPDRDYLQKVVAQGGTVDPVEVDGEPGFWIGGEDHVLLYLSPDGDQLEDTLRLAGPTLLWQHDGLILRLEGEITRGEALRLASSVR